MTYSSCKINFFILLCFLIKEGCVAAPILNSTVSRAGRHKRWEDEAYDDYSGGEIDYTEETEEEARIKKLLLNWEKLALKGIFGLSFISLIFMVWFICCKNCCKYLIWGPLKEAFIDYWTRFCPCCVKDKQFHRMKVQAEKFGLKLTPSTFAQLRRVAEQAAETMGYDTSNQPAYM
ncbi:uncharacterized protein LOC133193158 [Saccostrea echinata]|uniref:uncharacterized protein LOC133193158 n=1 Tax=Saccostrea echinata TaxID=191078 RepID=UPI002A80ABBA|nr:uncharacterized protein LOC133193158 [Saccostrea echinata]